MNEPRPNNFARNQLQGISQSLTFLNSATQPVAAMAEGVLLNPHTIWANALLGILLVSIPVFFEAPLVRLLPWLSLVLAGGWFWLSDRLANHPPTRFIGELLFGFSWSWLAGAIYWGWFRWEPLWHLPIESIGLPMALWGVFHGRRKAGYWFYLGSLLGTAITDVYFYWMDLMPYWRQLMVAAPDQTLDIIQLAFTHVQTPEGAIAAATCALVLLTLAWMSWHSSHRHNWIFSGTLLGTLLVDSLFVLLAKV